MQRVCFLWLQVKWQSVLGIFVIYMFKSLCLWNFNRAAKKLHSCILNPLFFWAVKDFAPLGREKTNSSEWVAHFQWLRSCTGLSKTHRKKKDLTERKRERETVTKTGFESCVVNMLLSLWCCNFVPNANTGSDNETNQPDRVIHCNLEEDDHCLSSEWSKAFFEKCKNSQLKGCETSDRLSVKEIKDKDTVLKASGDFTFMWVYSQILP